MVGTSRYLQFRSLKWPLTRGEIIQIQMAPATDPSRIFLLKEVHGVLRELVWCDDVPFGDPKALEKQSQDLKGFHV